MTLEKIHLAGSYDGGLQLCVLCGAKIIDDRGACVAILPGEETHIPGGYAEGAYVYVVSSPGITSSGITDDEPNCLEKTETE